jgi:ABC-type sugar transport system ATPase subunit
LRDGRFVATRPVRETDENEIIRFMVGRDIEASVPAAAAPFGETVLSVRNLSSRGTLDDVSFDVRRGEIIAVAGLMGSGKTQLAEAVYGLIPTDAGGIMLDGREARISGPHEAIALGIGFVAEDRRISGILPDMSVLHNLTIAIIGRLTHILGLKIRRSSERKCFDDYAGRLDIRFRDPGQKIQLLSGGNQQKVLLGRALAAECSLLVLCEPTRGVDVGAKAEIHALMRALAGRGAGILMISSDLPEILTVADSCLVMHRGRITGRFDRDGMTETNIAACATGQELSSAGGRG